MKVLVVGSGGREHALAWKIAQSTRVDRVFVAPGNAGTALDTENVDVPPSDFERLLKFAKENGIGLTVVGPEAPLCDGIVDAFSAEGLRVFGPSKAAAQLEGSKVFCKNMLHSADVPTADYQVFRDAESAERFIKDRYASDDQDVPVVIKADGLAAGKGAIVCSRRREALEAIDRIARQREFGDAGDQLIIEERLDGQEASVLAITDGRTIVTLPACQDHKPALDGDKGPNTGGMGAHSPAGVLGGVTGAQIIDQIVRPTVQAMNEENRRFAGVLYAGLMLTADGPRVLEYNVRFGDPECQPIMLRMEDDLLPVLASGAAGRFETSRLKFRKEAAACIVLASEGYPEKPIKGGEITGLADAARHESVEIFHAATAVKDDRLVAAGGRVLNVCASGAKLRDALKRAYIAANAVNWPHKVMRHDIGRRVLGAVSGIWRG